MDTQKPLSSPVLSKETSNSKSPLILTKISGFALVLFALSVSTGFMFLPETTQRTSDQIFHCLLLSMACLTFFLGVILLLLLFTMNTTNPLVKIWARLIDHLAIATLISSFITIIITVPQLYMSLSDLNELLYGKVDFAIQSGLIYFALFGLYKLIIEKLTSCLHKCFNVAFFALAIAFAGLYTWPLYDLPCTSPYSSFIYQTNHLYHIALLPITFLLGSILLILGVVPATGLRLPFSCVVQKEALTVSTLAVGLITLLTGTLSIISFALDNLDKPGGFGIGGTSRAIHVGAL